MSKCLICGKDVNNFLFCSREHRIEYDKRENNNKLEIILKIFLIIISIATTLSLLLSLW